MEGGHVRWITHDGVAYLAVEDIAALWELSFEMADDEPEVVSRAIAWVRNEMHRLRDFSATMAVDAIEFGRGTRVVDANDAAAP